MTKKVIGLSPDETACLKLEEYLPPGLATSSIDNEQKAIPEALHREWFQQIWDLGGASTRQHPAPYPLVLAERLVRMFSFVGDTVLDPFMGTGTTNLAAKNWGRHSVGFEIEPSYFEMVEKSLSSCQQSNAKPEEDKSKYKYSYANN